VATVKLGGCASVDLDCPCRKLRRTGSPQPSGLTWLGYKSRRVQRRRPCHRSREALADQGTGIQARFPASARLSCVNLRSGVCVIVLSNTEDAAVGRIAEEIRRIAVGAPPGRE
jgi:hypothetical protein